jgi:hypothetical protein
MNIEIHRQTVARALGSLESAIQRLVAALSHQPIWIMAAETADDSSAIRATCEAYAAIDYGMEDEVGGSVVCLGVIGASADILKRAIAVNLAKADLKKVCAPLQRTFVRVPVKNDAAKTKAIPLIRVILRSIQRSDLNLLAAYRKVPILEAPPASVTYTQARTRSVYRKTLYEVEELLANVEGPAATADRARLQTLGRHVRHLALVRPHYRNIRANVLYARLDPRGRGRMQIAAELPLIYATGRSIGRPAVKFPRSDTPDADQPQRIRESSIEDQPFLHSLPIYRYLDAD